LESQKASGLSVAVFCLQEGVSLSTFYRWQQQLKSGVPTALLEEEADRQRVESEHVSEATFLTQSRPSVAVSTQ
jgi:translation elongation factor EF-G